MASAIMVFRDHTQSDRVDGFIDSRLQRSIFRWKKWEEHHERRMIQIDEITKTLNEI